MSYWICDKDQNCIDCPKHYPEETCEHWIEVEPVKDIHTEADFIRAMTDEELADILARSGASRFYVRSDTEALQDEKWRWFDWLKQEVKE